MHRKVLIDWFYTAKGRLLKQQEAAFLERSITVSCKQVIVQIGALGWENDFMDCEAYQQFYVLDDEQSAWHKVKQVRGLTYALPFQVESVDMVILPHTLEFDADKHQLLREVSRILKPEGKLIVLGFNPWNIYVNLQYLKQRKQGTPWLPRLVSRSKITDWLNLLNFEVTVSAGFNFNKQHLTEARAKEKKSELGIAAYGVTAIKRCYRLIPLTPVKGYKKQLGMAKVMDVSVREKEYEER